MMIQCEGEMDGNFCTFNFVYFFFIIQLVTLVDENGVRVEDTREMKVKKD